jgi:predicted metal-dependent phosphoesterase TrpH
MLRVELHCHTIYSKDSLTTPEQLLEACERKRIDRVAVTDHNVIDGALVAYKLDPQRVIVGEEIYTSHGELLAFFVKEFIPGGLSPMETIKRLREQEAFISVSHPFDQQRGGHWEESDLLEITPYIDAIETFNARCTFSRYNEEAQDFAMEHNLLETVGSDAHAVKELGTATLLIADFSDAVSFKKNLEKAEQNCRLSPFWVHFYSRYAVWRKKVIGIE